MQKCELKIKYKYLYAKKGTDGGATIKKKLD